MNDALSHVDAFTLQHMLHDLPAQPEPPERCTWSQLDTATQLASIAERADFLQSDFIVKTPELIRSMETLSTVQQRNGKRKWGRYAALFDGPSGAGKTTALFAAAAAHLDTPRQKDRDTIRGLTRGDVRVVYVEVPGKATAKSLLEAFLEKICIPTPRRATIGELTAIVVENIYALGVELILIDELQHLAYRNQSVIEATNTLKSLTNSVTATFVYAGVNIRESALMAGAHGQQLRRRTVRQPLSTMTLATPEGRAEWRGIIRIFEKTAGLLDHEVGSLMQQHQYLFSRAGGSIGTLRHMISDAALDLFTAHDAALRAGAATDFRERIGREQLEKAVLDMEAEFRSGTTTDAGWGSAA